MLSKPDDLPLNYSIIFTFVANGLKELVLIDFHSKFGTLFGKQDLKDFLCQDNLNKCGVIMYCVNRSIKDTRF